MPVKLHQQKECIFCREEDKDMLVHESKFWRVILHPKDQTYLGRCIVILKRHCGELSGLEEEEWLDFTRIVKMLESALKKAFKATMYNWSCGLNIAYQYIPPIPHVHWHLFPRYNQKVEFAGLIFEDAEFGHHYKLGARQKVSDRVVRAIIKKISETFGNSSKSNI